MKPRFIIDEKGNKKEVVLTIKQYEKLVDKLEDLEDDIVGLKYRAKKTHKYIPFEEVVKSLGINKYAIS